MKSFFLRLWAAWSAVAWRHDPHHAFKPSPSPVHDTEAEERKLMQEAISGDTPIAILDHPEYIEGWVGVAGKRLLTNLRNGLYSVQGQIDLHGLNRAEAQIAVEDYIISMSRFRPCCVKIIHGRGINSPADQCHIEGEPSAIAFNPQNVSLCGRLCLCAFPRWRGWSCLCSLSRQ